MFADLCRLGCARQHTPLRPLSPFGALCFVAVAGGEPPEDICRVCVEWSGLRGFEGCSKGGSKACERVGESGRLARLLA